MWAERSPFKTTEEQSLFYSNTLKMKNGCRFHTLQSLMVLTSRDKIFGFKRKIPFWKTLCYKKENLKCFHCCWSSSEEDTSKSQVSWETTWGSHRTHWTQVCSLSKQVYQWTGSLFLNHLIARSWLENKQKKQQQSNTFKMSFTDLHRKVLDFCEEKNILLFIGNNEHYAAVSTSHTFEQSFIYSVNI